MTYRLKFVETERFELSSSQGNLRAFYMLSRDWDCRESGRLAAGQPSSVDAFVSSVVNIIIQTSAASRCLLIQPAARRPGRQWLLLNPPD